MRNFALRRSLCARATRCFRRPCLPLHPRIKSGPACTLPWSALTHARWARQANSLDPVGDPQRGQSGKQAYWEFVGGLKRIQQLEVMPTARLPYLASAPLPSVRIRSEPALDCRMPVQPCQQLSRPAAKIAL